MVAFNGMTSYDNYHYFCLNFPSEAALTQINASQCRFLWSCNIRNWQLEILIGPVTENIMTAQWLILSDLVFNSKVNFYLTTGKHKVVRWWVQQMGQRKAFLLGKKCAIGLGAIIKLAFKWWSQIIDTNGLLARLNCQPLCCACHTNGSRHQIQHGRLPTSDWLEALSQRPPDSCQADWHLIITDLVWSPVILTQRQNVSYNTTQIAQSSWSWRESCF